MRVHDRRPPVGDETAQATHGEQVELRAHANGRGGDARGLEAIVQRRTRDDDDERLVATLAKAGGEQQDLALATAPFTAGVQMQHTDLLAGGGGRNRTRSQGCRSRGSL